ncbi:MAG: nicotinamide mononucleotide transporter [Prevotellaceae bacterium]|jgi:nicotinamide riboside transporter PnuC|nr:nicotinamide mononucleotide transporter [Prevotellaceae bacterium]
MSKLTIQAIKNLGIAAFMTLGLAVAMYLLKIEIVFDKLLIFSVISTVSGVAGIMTIRNPQNYTGFYLGMISSAFLAAQFFFMEKFDLTFLYLIVFIPFQFSGLVNWKRISKSEIAGETRNDNNSGKLRFLPSKRQIFYFSIFILLFIIDYVFASFCLKNYENVPIFSKIFEKTAFAVMISSSILSNWLMIGKWLDAWVYWLIYSVSAIVSALIIHNNFNLLLFAFFLIINAISFVSWLKQR